MGVGSSGYLYKPDREGGASHGLVILPPQYNNQVQSVHVVDSEGNILDEGNYRHPYKTGGGIWDFKQQGGSYGTDTQVRVTLDNGEQVYYGGGGAGRDEGGAISAGQVGGGGTASGGRTVGTGANQVFIPDFVNFNPEEFYISLQQALDAAHQEGNYNIGKYTENFGRAEKFAMDTLDTEAKGLESYIPRSSKLIRQADAQGNADILAASEVFDARNQGAARKATLGNVQLRKSLFEQQFPGVFKSQDALRTGAESDLARIRKRESEPFLDSVIKETAARSARNNAADIAASGGFGINSGAGTNLVDRFDFDTRIKLREQELQSERAGDQAISNAESSVQNAIIGSQNLFSGVIAPGIQDFKSIQPTPRVTDIGGQIRAMPTRDAGSIRSQVTQDLTNISTISPTTAFNGSIDTQKYNSGIGLQALQFQQMQNNVVASAENSAVALDKGDQVRQEQLDAFYAGLQAREDSQNTQGITQLATTGLGILGNLISDYQSKDPNSAEGQAAHSGISGFLTDFVNTIKGGANIASDFLNNTFGLDLGKFDIGSEASPGLDFGGIFNGGNSQTGTYGGDAYLNSLNQNSTLGGINTEDLGSTGFNYDTATTPSQLEDISLGDYNLGSNSDFGADLGKSLNLAQVKSVASGVDTLSKSDVTNSFFDPKQRGGLIEKAPALGISAQTIVQGWNLYDKWGSMTPTQRGTAAASYLTSLASQTGVISGSVPGAVTNLLTQSANLYSNYGKMTDGQRAQVAIQTTGALGTLAATIGQVGGPIGAAIAFGAAGLGRAANVAISQGVNGRDAFNVLANPITSYGVDYANNLTGGNISRRDATNISMFSNPLTTPIAVADQIFNLDLDFTSGKPKTQQFRDALRNGLESIGLATKQDGSHKIQLADGSFFDIGKDGNNKLKNVGKNIDGKTDRHYYDVDFSNPIAPEVVGWTNALSRVLFRSEAGSKFVGHLTNAAMSTDPTSLKASKANLQTFATNAGIDYNTGVQVLTKLRDAKQLSQEDYAAYRNGWMSLMLTK